MYGPPGPGVSMKNLWVQEENFGKDLKNSQASWVPPTNPCSDRIFTYSNNFDHIDAKNFSNC